MFMLNGDALRVSLSAADNVDVHASHVDLAATGNPTPGRTITRLTTATTQPVVAGPAASTTRTVKKLTINNVGAVAQVIAVLFYDGANERRIFRGVLAPNQSLQYHEAAGWWVADAEGKQNIVNTQFAGVPIVDQDVIVRLAADVTNNNATANTMQDVTGMSFPVLANQMYWFEFNVAFTTAAATTGSRWSINGPASPTYCAYQSKYTLTTTTSTENNHLQGYDLPAAANASAVAGAPNNWALVYGMIQPSADGTVILRFASEVASSAIVAKINSWARYRRISP